MSIKNGALRGAVLHDSAIATAGAAMSAPTKPAILTEVAARAARTSWPRSAATAATGIAVPSAAGTVTAAGPWPLGWRAIARASSVIPTAVITSPTVVATTSPIPVAAAIARTTAVAGTSPAIARPVVTRRRRVIARRRIITWRGIVARRRVVDARAVIGGRHRAVTVVNVAAAIASAVDRLRVRLRFVIASVTTCKGQCHQNGQQRSSIHGGLPDRGRARTSGAGRRSRNCRERKLRLRNPERVPHRGPRPPDGAPHQCMFDAARLIIPPLDSGKTGVLHDLAQLSLGRPRARVISGTRHHNLQ
jgi:hypothetical protein